MTERKHDVKWMYDGAHSSIDTEEYLTGRKIDKAFDRHAQSQSVSTSQDDQCKIDLVYAAKRSHISNSSVLDLETIKKEDPLVAIRVKEEQVRREIMDNPVKMKRLQRIVMKAMRKKMNKMMRKGEFPDFLKQYFEWADAQKGVQSSSSSPGLDSNSSTPNKRKRHVSSSDEGGDRKRPLSKDSFGLVYVGETSSGVRKNDSFRRAEKKVDKAEERRRSEQQQKLGRKLTDEEKEQRRRQMMHNAEWREQQRHLNQKRDEQRAQAEKVREEHAAVTASGAHFLRPVVAGALNSRTVEQMINSGKQHIQRRHDSMDFNFARK